MEEKNKISIENLEGIVLSSFPLNSSYIPPPHREFLVFCRKNKKKVGFKRIKKGGYNELRYFFYDRRMIVKLNKTRRDYNLIKEPGFTISVLRTLTPYLRLNFISGYAKVDSEELDVYMRQTGFIPKSYLRKNARICYLSKPVF